MITIQFAIQYVRRLFLWTILLSLFVSCGGATEYLIDVKKQVLYADNPKSTIGHIMLTEVYNTENAGLNQAGRTFFIRWGDSIGNAPKKLYFNNINKGYEIIYGAERIRNEQFKLIPNTKYEIEYFVGDRGSRYLYFYTNREGLIDSVKH